MIKMAHGSGGKETSTLIEKIFAKHFHNPILDNMEDAAVLSVKGKIAFTTDSFVVTPIFFRGGDIGRLAVCGTVNDLLMQGAVPKYLTAGFIIEEGMLLKELEKIAASMAETAKEAGVMIVAGDTKVIEGKGGIYINTSGIGEIEDNISISARHCEAGDVVILSGTLGDHHACILSHRMEIENTIASDAAPLNEMVLALMQGGIKIKAMRDVTRGGLGTILHEIAAASDKNITLYESKLPIGEEVKGLCDILGLEPLYMGNEGKFIAVIDSKDKEKALALLQASELGKKAAVIGEVSEGTGVTLVTPLGGSRHIDVLYGEGLPRIC